MNVDPNQQEQLVAERQLTRAPRQLRRDRGVDRLEAFSDGVFSVAITLLVLDFHPPAEGSRLADGALLPQLLDQWQVYAAYLLSFAVIGVTWVDHHLLFRYVSRSDRVLLALNGLLLLIVAFTPYPTTILSRALGNSGDQQNLAVAAAFYSLVVLLNGIFFNLIWHYAVRHHRLVDRRISSASLDRLSKRFIYWPFFYLDSLLVAPFSPYISLGIYLLVPLSYAIPNKADPLRPRTNKQPEQKELAS